MLRNSKNFIFLEKTMMRICVLMMLMYSGLALAQKTTYTIAEIPANLTENANAVVRSEKIDVNISSRRNMTIKTHRVVSVLNELGLRHIDAAEFRDVRLIDATVYDARGNEIKRLRRKDFKEIPYSAGSIITDNIATYLEYTPTQYPFTIVYESTITDSNTAFLPQWLPLGRANVGIENSTFTVTCPDALGLKFIESNFADYSIIKNTVTDGVSFSAINLPAFRNEQSAPDIESFMPHVKFAIESFHLEGVDGDVVNWENFSSWTYNNLIAGTSDLSDDTKERVKALVGEEKDPIEKAKIIYQYVQNKTRYVSIQVGIGGWRPMKAKDVDRLGYGDCKALTNYTRALLDVVDVPSYYAIIYGGGNKKDMNPEFVSMQGNHIILAIPNGDDIIWLECTSQIQPFGFLGDFTDDRLALLVKPAGGTLVRTSKYTGNDNSQISKGSYKLDGSGGISANIDIRSRGIQYDNKQGLPGKSVEELHLYYKDYFKVGNLKLASTKLENDKTQPELIESIAMNAPGYANVISNRLMFAVNAFNQYSNVPIRYKNRIAPVEIQRGFYDNDEITIELPAGYSVEAIPSNVSISEKYGQYSAEFTLINPSKMLYKRSLLINEGKYNPSEYEDYRKFAEQIARAENSKMVLVKN